MKKRLGAVLGAFVLLFSMGACNKTNANNYSQYEDGRLLLTIWAPDQYAGSAVKSKFEAFLEKFNDTEEIKALGVKLQFSAMTQLPTSLKTACMTGPNKMPDIVIWDRFATPSNTSYLLALDDMIAEDEVNTEAFLPEAYNELTVGGSQYGLPLDADPWGIYVNMDLVNAYNESAAEADKIDVNALDTWTAVMEAADKLTVRDGNTVTRSCLNTTSADGQFFSFIYTGTGELIETDT